ncbi:MAG: CBS domain-containing protein [Candidatus Pacearchaeota archaeon]
MSERIRVGDVMTRNYIHVKPDTNLLECAKTMIKNRVGSIVLKENDTLHGILTEKDIIWALTKKAGKNIKDISAKDVANKKLITIKPEASLKEALEKMNSKKIRRMPVVNNKKVIGYITMKDIVKFMPEIYEESRAFEKIREETEKIQRSKSAVKGEFIEASCEECGNFDILENIDGRMICESCRDEM